MFEDIIKGIDDIIQDINDDGNESLEESWDAGSGPWTTGQKPDLWSTGQGDPDGDTEPDSDCDSCADKTEPDSDCDGCADCGIESDEDCEGCPSHDWDLVDDNDNDGWEI